MKEINPSFATIDLSAALPDLFKYGTLDVCNDNLLIGLLTSLNISALKKLNFKETSDPFDTLEAIVGLADTLDLSSMLKGIDIADYVTINKAQRIGDICLGDLLEDFFATSLSLGLANDSLESGSTYAYLDGTTDSAPADNRLKINLTTMAYSALQ